MTFGPVLDAALVAQEACESAGLRGCVIGGIALQRWGEPRYTADVDLSVLVETGHEAAVTQALLARLEPRIGDAAGFASRTRVVLARSSTGVGIDIVLAGLPYEMRVVERSSHWDLGSARLRTCSAEDLLVMKTFAGRDKDWADITGILERQGHRLDLNLVRQELQPLLAAKEEPDLAHELERRIARHVTG
ncbi:MAG TPA: nucleotidyl transferase AbiEii/AbiGii toxin family protein [Gammaproteobacteria bacterium]|nr:nucleotidyl transferase AbiEii/AbiGii toxin family protein [Gammaproteobacteria bacterium]